MKSWFFRFLICFLMPLSSLLSVQPFVEIKGGYFEFREQTLRKIFHQGGVTVEGDVGAFINDYFAIDLNAQYFSKKGRGLHSEYNTHVDIPTLALFFKGFYPLNDQFKPYAGIGPRLFFFRNTNQSPYVLHKVNRDKFGFAVTLGALLQMNCHFYLDPFFDYSWVKISPPKSDFSSCQYSIRLDGFTTGLGIGYLF